jgi:hypothetical protein
MYLHHDKQPNNHTIFIIDTATVRGKFCKLEIFWLKIAAFPLIFHWRGREKLARNLRKFSKEGEKSLLVFGFPSFVLKNINHSGAH